MRLLFTILLASTICSGCTMFTRTVYVPDGKMVRTRRTVQNWPIWVKEDPTG